MEFLSVKIKDIDIDLYNMTKKQAIQLFEERKVRTIWDCEHRGKRSNGDKLQPVKNENNLWQIEKK